MKSFLGGGFHPGDFAPERKKEAAPEPPKAPPPPPKTSLDPGLVGLACHGIGELVKFGVNHVKEQGRFEAAVLQLAHQLMGIVTVTEGARELKTSQSRVQKQLDKLVSKACCQRTLSKTGEEIYVFEQYLPRLWACDHCDQQFSKPAPSCRACGAELKEKVCRPEPYVPRR